MPFSVTLLSHTVQVRVPSEFQGAVIGDVNRRKGVIHNSEGEDGDAVVSAQVGTRQIILSH